jgi:hypothetical protein
MAQRRHQRLILSGLDHTACTHAVYASQRRFPDDHARLASQVVAYLSWVRSWPHSIPFVISGFHIFTFLHCQAFLAHAMLKRLGFTRYVYDWRAEHLPTMTHELQLAQQQGIAVQGVWMWIDGNKDRPGALSADNEQVFKSLHEANLSTQIWLGFNDNYFRDLADEEKVTRGAQMVKYITERAADHSSRVALYNHGDWFGEPENEVRIIQALPKIDIGIIYSFHHGKQQLGRFDAVLKLVRPYLWAVNLNGMRPDGPMIMPFGSGTHERAMLKKVVDSGFVGPFGVLGHVDGDVEVVLRENLRGLGF